MAFTEDHIRSVISGRAVSANRSARHSCEGFRGGIFTACTPIRGQQSGERAGSRLARMLSVPVRGFSYLGRRAHGHVTDRAGREGRY